MNYNLSPNSIRVYKSRLRKLVKVLPIAEEQDKDAIKREIIALENKLGVRAEDILEDKPGRKPLYGVDISKYNSQLVQASLRGLPEEEDSATRLARLEEMSKSAKVTPKAVVKSPGPVQEYIAAVQFHIARALQTEGEEREHHIKEAKANNAMLPEHRRLDDQIKEVSQTKEEKEKDFQERMSKLTLNEQLAAELAEEDRKVQLANEEFGKPTTGQ